ncbi:MAG: sigma-54-dependent Fis family transcriptional regulator [Desulfomonile tiedjei]|uniref:Sigma-54-dependent Fis family transcriptional regulator n=1 Tax=Desulfomonile tiedjei TaxID=2358 RepID=A0A9D6UWW4_9BACT|nr:sigma-54-dependent Fis family transcriptional regulator [Desulfomonile tiedjei]
MRSKVCIIDDQNSILESMEMFFKIRNWDVYTATNGPDGIRLVDEVRPFLVILDIRLPGMDGLEVLEKLRGRFPDLRVIVITAFQNMESTIQAIKLGAFDYLHKPIDIAEMDSVIHRLELNASADPHHEIESLDQAFEPSAHRPQIIARSRKMKEVFKTIALISESRVTVLIQGESGTGKELIARSIHDNSPWRDRPFTVMDCSTLVDSLVQSELFGYEKGAFTGATDTRKGRLELTGEGTILFDEIGELPLMMQSKLLRFLQSGEFVRVGGNRRIYSDARIIAATNRNLTKLVQEGKFREDLYYRLKVVTIDVPPLRNRRSDIPVLASFFLQKAGYRNASEPKRLSPKGLELLMDYDWPGNIRQLENLMIRCAVLTPSAVLRREHVEACLGDSPTFATTVEIATSMEEVERGHILRVLDTNEWHLGKTCDQLGMSRPTLRAKMKKYELHRRNSRKSRKTTSGTGRLERNRSRTA